MNRALKELVIAESKTLFPEVKALRRALHANPELSFREYGTASFISNWLQNEDIPHKTGVGGTGIIATVNGTGGDGKRIALRAELDALPITERGDKSYISRNSGAMHACGHDAHMAMLMGTGKLLNKLRSHFRGKAILIFQPGEEKNPGGASIISQTSELREEKPDMVIAQHLLPEMSTGTVGYRGGEYMASADEIHITVKGKGGHAALPHLVTDQVYIASLLVVRIKERIKEEQNKNGHPTVLGIGHISGEGATNIIPETVKIAGTFRTFNEEWRTRAAEITSKICSETAREFGVIINLEMEKGYPVLINDPLLAEEAERLSIELLGKEKVIRLEQRMGSDDFSFYSQIWPSLYYRAGAGKSAGETRTLHTPEFDIEEEALITGVANLSWLTLNFAGCCKPLPER